MCVSVCLSAAHREREEWRSRPSGSIYISGFAYSKPTILIIKFVARHIHIIHTMYIHRLYISPRSGTSFSSPFIIRLSDVQSAKVRKEIRFSCATFEVKISINPFETVRDSRPCISEQIINVKKKKKVKHLPPYFFVRMQLSLSSTKFA